MKSQWEYFTVGKLREYERMKDAVANLTEELERLEAESVGLRCSLGSEPVQGGGNKQQENAINNLAMRWELKNQLDKVNRWLAPVERALASLSAEDRMIVERMYISRGSRAEIELCEELNMDRTTIWRRCNTAVFRLSVALYGSIA